MIVLELPAPPSTNNLYLNLRKGKGRTRSPEYLNWQISAGWHVQTARQKAIDGPVSVHLIAQENPRRDLDSYWKATLDLLVAHRLIADDCNKHVRELHASWSKDQEGIRVTVFPLASVDSVSRYSQEPSPACISRVRPDDPNDAGG